LELSLIILTILNITQVRLGNIQLA